MKELVRLGGDNEGGVVRTYNKEEKTSIKLTTYSGNGKVRLFNKEGEERKIL